MNAHKRGASLLAISSILLGAASYAAAIAPGQAEQRVTDNTAILISTIAEGHEAPSTSPSRERAHRATDGKRSTRAAGLDVVSSGGQPAEQTVARTTEGGNLDVVLKSLPRRDSRTSDCS